MRLEHFLTLSSVGTRKKVKEYIYDGKVCINQEICLIPSQEIDENQDKITYLGERVYLQPVYYVLHKPQGCITARSEMEYTVFDCLEGVDTKGLFAVGRLDKDTEGLLFLTNDGQFNHQLMAPTNHVTKKYTFFCLGEMTDQKKELIETGIEIGEGEWTKPASFQLLKEGIYETLLPFIGLEKLTKLKKEPKGQKVFFGELTIEEGKKHQVKRMLRHVGCPILYLKRIAIGNFYLQEELKVGEYRKLEKEELDISI